MAMVRRRIPLLPITCLLVTAVALAAQSPSAERPDAVREIPGLTGQDPFPRGCVDCHTQRDGLAAPLSVLMSRWYRGITPRLLQFAELSAPAGLRLEGRHPRAERSLRDIPSGCLPCHGPNARRAPAFGPLVHMIHLQGGAENGFLSKFGGECTYCHKPDTARGVWRVPSAPER
jgi:hypothetical protein